jgi:hypothetical protein
MLVGLGLSGMKRKEPGEWALTTILLIFHKNPDIRTQKIGCRTQFSD